MEDSFTEKEWMWLLFYGTLQPARISFLITRALALKCRNPTEATLKRWSNMILMMSQVSGGHAHSDYVLAEKFYQTKVSIRNEFDRARRDSQHCSLETLPSSMPTLRSEYDLFTAVFPDANNQPVASKIDKSRLDALDSAFRCRSITPPPISPPPTSLSSSSPPMVECGNPSIDKAITCMMEGLQRVCQNQEMLLSCSSGRSAVDQPRLLQFLGGE